MLHWTSTATVDAAGAPPRYTVSMLAVAAMDMPPTAASSAVATISSTGCAGESPRGRRVELAAVAALGTGTAEGRRQSAWRSHDLLRDDPAVLVDSLEEPTSADGRRPATAGPASADGRRGAGVGVGGAVADELVSRFGVVLWMGGARDDAESLGDLTESVRMVDAVTMTSGNVVSPGARVAVPGKVSATAGTHSDPHDCSDGDDAM